MYEVKPTLVEYQKQMNGRDINTCVWQDIQSMNVCARFCDKAAAHIIVAAVAAANSQHQMANLTLAHTGKFWQIWSPAERQQLGL